MIEKPFNFWLFKVAETLGEKDPSNLLEMPSHLLNSWIAYLQIRDGVFKPEKTTDEKVDHFGELMGL